MVKKRYGIDKKPGRNRRPPKQESKSNAVLQKAGISPRKKREKYSRANPAATDRYNKTYELLDDETLKANFKSQNKNVVAAMLVAVDKLADQGLYFDASTPKANKSMTKLLQQYYDETLQSIEAGNKAGSYDPEKITRVDKKKAAEKRRAETEKANQYNNEDPAAPARYGKTYEALDNKKLKANFESDNKQVVAAMLMATDSVAATGLELRPGAARSNRRVSELLAGTFDQKLEAIEAGKLQSDYNPAQLSVVNEIKNRPPEAIKPVIEAEKPPVDAPVAASPVAKTPASAEANIKKGTKFLAAAGIKQTSKRQQYSAANEGALERYGRTHDLLEDEELKANFESENKNVVAAMLIATDQLADNGAELSASDPAANKRLSAVLGGLFAVALAEIESGQAASSYNPDKLIAIDKKQAKKRQREEQKGKAQASTQERLQAEKAAAEKQKRRIKPNVFSVVEDCETKKCAINSYTLTLSKPMAMTPSDILNKIKAKMSGKLGKVNESAASKMPMPGDKPLVLDLQAVGEAIDLTEVHIIAGQQNFWTREVSIAAKGSCDHGNEDKCPEVDLQCHEQPIDDTKQNVLYMGQGHPKISNLRLYPRTVPFSETFTWQYFKDTFLAPKNRAPVPYYFSARSCHGYYHSEYFAIVKAHAPSVLSIGFSYSPAYPGVEGGSDKSSFSIKVYNRNDHKEFTKEINPQDIQDVMSTLGLGWFSGLLGFTRKFVRMVAHFTSDETSMEDEPEDEELGDLPASDEAGSDEPMSDEAGSDKKEKAPPRVVTWGWRAPQYHFAYRRILSEVSDYSRVDYDEQIFLAASPFLQFGVKINLVEMLYSSVAAPAAARQAVKEAAGAVYNAVSSGLSTVAAFVLNIVKGEIADEGNRPASEVTEQEAEARIFSASGSFECMLDIHYAIETDNPGAGLIWNKSKDTGKWLFDDEGSGLYTGFNLQLTGELTGFLKVTRFAVASGYRFDVLAADNTAPSRMSLEIRPFAGLSAVPKLECFGSFNELALYDAAYFKTGRAAMDEKEQKSSKKRNIDDIDNANIDNFATGTRKKMRLLMKKPSQWPRNLNVKKDKNGNDIKQGAEKSLDSSVFS